MTLPEGRKPISDDWYARQLRSYRNDIDRMQNSRDFGVNTCPASRHTQMIAESLSQAHRGSKIFDVYPMLEEEPNHCAASIASVVSSLYQARSFLQSLGYTWTVDSNGTVVWSKENEQRPGNDSV